MATETLRLGKTWKRLDGALTAEGIELACPYREGLSVTVLPHALFNPRFGPAVEAHARRTAESTNGSQPRVTDRLNDPEFVVDALVGGMGPLFNAADEEVEYTRERGLKILADPAHADVLAWIGNEALEFGRYYTESVEADAKNSSPGSSGKKAGVGRSGATRN